MELTVLLAALDRATGEFGRRLNVVADEDWEAATPCAEWDVRYLVAHVVGGNRFAALILAGARADEAMDVVMGTQQLGRNPREDFDESAAAQRDGFGRSGALDRLVSHPLGDVTGERFLRMRVFDVAVHAWDLAVAIGDDPGLDEGLVETVLEIVRHEAPGMGFGIEPCGDVGPDASSMELLLDLTGRCHPAHTSP
jgi:uncharacterized protein (TIGR03086 family)